MVTTKPANRQLTRNDRFRLLAMICEAFQQEVCAESGAEMMYEIYRPRMPVGQVRVVKTRDGRELPWGAEREGRFLTWETWARDGGPMPERLPESILTKRRAAPPIEAATAAEDAAPDQSAELAGAGRARRR